MREATAQRGAVQLRLPFPPCRARGVYGAPAAAAVVAATPAAVGCCLYGEEEEEKCELSDTSRSCHRLAGGGAGWRSRKGAGMTNLSGCAMAPAGVQLAKGWAAGGGGRVTGAGGYVNGVAQSDDAKALYLVLRCCGAEIGSGGRWPRSLASRIPSRSGAWESIRLRSMVISTFALAFCQGRELSVT